MRTRLLWGGLVLLSTFSFAQPGHRDAKSFLADALAGEIEALGGQQLGALSGADIEAAMDRLSIAVQQDAYVHGAARASIKLPGLGQLMIGDTTSGVLFIAGSVAIHVGALLGSYVLLPADLKLDQLLYLDTSKAAIEAAWKAHTPRELLPAAGVALAGAMADGVLRAVAARHASRVARQQVDSGAVEFEPQLLVHGGGLQLRLPMPRG